MNSLKQFVALLSLLFALPWLILVLYPSVKLSGLGRTQVETEGGTKAAYPPSPRGLAERGAEIYAQNGCVYCHTQMIRPTYAGTDRWRPGWGGREGEEGNFVRETLPTDYLDEKVAFLGVQRLGPDLSNVGWRRMDPAWHYLHLYDPRQIAPESVMPAFRNLFRVQPVGVQRSDDALDVTVPDEDGREMEVVPTEDARALVAYLLSLKKDYPKPAANLTAK